MGGCTWDLAAGDLLAVSSAKNNEMSTPLERRRRDLFLHQSENAGRTLTLTQLTPQLQHDDDDDDDNGQEKMTHISPQARRETQVP